MDTAASSRPESSPAPDDDVRELVAHAWFTIGYPPLGSAVLVALGRAGDPGFVARVDLPRRAEQAAPVAAMLAAGARHAGVRRAVLLVVLGPRPRPRPVLARAERTLVRSLHAALRRDGTELADVVVIGGESFRSLFCVDPACCPDTGVPLGDLRITSTAAALVLRGRSLAVDEADLVADVRPRPWPAPPAVPAGAGALSAPAALERWRALVAGRLDAAPGPDPAPGEVAWLVPALADLRFRDAALVTLLPGADDTADELAAGRVRGPVELGAAERAHPDPGVFEAGRALLAAVARGAPPGSRADALAVLAWMTWWQGAGARARLLAALALADRPGHRLAALVDQLLLRQVPPGWTGGCPSGAA